jgi:hypothetical protein
MVRNGFWCVSKVKKVIEKWVEWGAIQRAPAN